MLTTGRGGRGTADDADKSWFCPVPPRRLCRPRPVLDMNDTVLVNLHCHTIFSDGEQTPEALAANLAAAGVRYAALTDHNSLVGLPRFQDALQKRGVAYLSGVEVTTWFHGREAHLLGYGFDTQHADLDATLFSLRQARNLEVHSIASSLRKSGASRPGDADDPPGISAAPDGWLEIGEAIDLLHRAGGQAFWAHPLLYEVRSGAAGRLCGGAENAGAGRP